jgi:rare lipoprotein A
MRRRILLAAVAVLAALLALGPGCGGRRDAVRPNSPQRDAIQTGTASWYGRQFAGRRTASGEIFRPQDLTAAHPTLPFGTQVRVVNVDNGRSIDVRINDRGPFARHRILDVSEAAARKLGFHRRGVARVRLEYREPNGAKP